MVDLISRTITPPMTIIQEPLNCWTMMAGKSAGSTARSPEQGNGSDRTCDRPELCASAIGHSSGRAKQNTPRRGPPSKECLNS